MLQKHTALPFVNDHHTFSFSLSCMLWRDPSLSQMHPASLTISFAASPLFVSAAISLACFAFSPSFACVCFFPDHSFSRLFTENPIRVTSLECSLTYSQLPSQGFSSFPLLLFFSSRLLLFSSPLCIWSLFDSRRACFWRGEERWVFLTSKNLQLFYYPPFVHYTSMSPSFLLQLCSFSTHILAHLPYIVWLFFDLLFAQTLLALSSV